MHRYHQEILAEIKKISPKAEVFTKCNHGVDLNRYMRTSKPMYNLSSEQGRVIAKNWAKSHPDLSLADFVVTLNSLYQGQTHTERTFGGRLLEYYPKLRGQLDPQLVKKWLTGAQGWGEVDSLCQSSFPAKEVLAKWPEWKKLLEELVSDPDVHKRRACLVLLCKSVRESEDPRLSEQAFANLERLKGEKDILITKAISWLLRDLIKNHRQEVGGYLDKNLETLPRIAVREARNKLNTGKK